MRRARAQTPGRRRRLVPRRTATARGLSFHALMAVLLTWPLIGHLTTSLPFGTEDVETVPLFNLWTLRWNEMQIGDVFRHYWDAPIFHPTSGALALSEPQPLTGLFFAPIAWATRNPVLAYNVTLLAILTLNGFAAARLARRLLPAVSTATAAGAGPPSQPGGARVWCWPAALAGVLAQALPFVSNQLGVLQLTVLFPVFFLADALVCWAPRGGRRRALAIGGWLAATFLTCGYYGLFAVVVLGLASLTLVRRSWFTWTRLGDLGLAAGVFAVFALPVMVAQARYTEPYARSESTITGLSAMPVDFVRLHPDALGATVMPWLADEGGTAHYLYPGTMLLLLAVGGLLVALPGLLAAEPGVGAGEGELVRPQIGGASVAMVDGDRNDLIDRRRRVLFVVNAVLLAFVLSFGLRLSLGGFRPYDILRDHVPGYRNLRSPYRLAVLAEIFLVPLAALGLDALWGWRPGPAGARARGSDRVPGSAGVWRAVASRLGPILAVVVVVLGVAEVSAVPQRLFVVPDTAADWATWLHDGPPPATGDGSVAMVPFPVDGDVGSYEQTAQWMLMALDHGHPLVNGYSGLFPASYDDLEAEMRRFPDGDGLELLREHRVSYLVVMRSWLTPPRQQELDGIPNLTPVFNGTDAVVYRLGYRP